MANRYWNQFKGSLENAVIMLDGYARINSSGVVVSETIKGASVAKSGTAGEYTITLEDSYPKLLSCSLTATSLGTNANGDWKVKQCLKRDGSDCGPELKDVKSIVIVSTASTGAPTTPTVECGVLISLVLKNSVV